MRRNKITPQRCDDLVFVHYNIRLLSRRTPQYREGETKMWNISGDASNSIESAGVLVVANFSLDEADMKVVLFRDEIGENEDF